MKKNKLKKNIVRRKRSSNARKKSRSLEMVIVAIFALVVIYAASFAIRITHGVSKTVEAPQYTVRLQILNGCGVNGAAGKLARVLSNMVKLPLEVIVVDVDDFDAYHVEKTFLISHDNDTDPLKILADQLNLSDEISIEEIPDNYRSITGTLVLGDDYKQPFQLTSKIGSAGN
jgi:hypothetical protein